MSGYVVFRRGRFGIDLRRRSASLLTNEIVLQQLVRFLDENFKDGGGMLLDAGAGARPYLPVYRKYFPAFYSLDVPHSPHGMDSVDVIASVQRLPFRDESFDCILLTEVLEHVPDPVKALEECRRVLKANGKIFLTTPFFIPLHEIPYDYFRYTPFALRHMGEQAGLRVESMSSKGGFWAFALMFVQSPWVRFWQRLSRKCHLPLLHPYNPLVYLTIILPQLIYVVAWRRWMGNANGNGGYVERTVVTLGYVTILGKA